MMTITLQTVTRHLRMPVGHGYIRATHSKTPFLYVFISHFIVCYCRQPADLVSTLPLKELNRRDSTEDTRMVVTMNGGAEVTTQCNSMRDNIACLTFHELMLGFDGFAHGVHALHCCCTYTTCPCNMCVC